MSDLQSAHKKLAKNGISFLELTISILILGIFAAVAMPVYSNSLMKYRAEVTAQRLKQDIIQTQQFSRQSSTNRSITFSSSDSSYTVTTLQSMDRPSESYKVSLSQSPYRVEIVSLVTAAQPTTQQSNLTLVFDRFGMPDQGISVIVQASSFQKRVDVAPISGRVAIQ